MSAAADKFAVADFARADIFDNQNADRRNQQRDSAEQHRIQRIIAQN